MTSELLGLRDRLAPDHGLGILPAWLRDLPVEAVRDTPLILCGYDPVLSPLQVYMLLLQGFRIRHFADDTKQGETIGKKEFLNSFQLCQLPQLKESILINCATHNQRHYRNYEALAKAMDLRMLNIHQLAFYLRRVGQINLRTTIDSSYFVTSVIEKLEDYLAIDGAFEDDESRRVWHGILMGRLTADMGHFQNVYTDVSEMYFPGCFKYQLDEILVDAGACDGADTVRYLRKHHHQLNAAYLYEISSENRAAIRTNLEQFNGLGLSTKLHVREKGLWHRAETLQFTGESLYAILDEKIETPNHATESRPTEVIDLDSDLESATLIKLEIEGAEQNALEGAERILREGKPKLAVSLYHQSDDILTVLRFLTKLDLGYRYRLSHHWGSEIRTLLYCATEFADG